MNSKRLMTIGLATFAVLLLPSAKAQTEPDKAFLKQASQSDYDEIRLSTLAAGKTSNPAVNAFANKMITDHTKLEQQMKPFANRWGLGPVKHLDAVHQVIYEKLNGLTGDAFDKAYIRAMDKDHHQALAAFQAELQTTNLPEFKQAVAQGEKVIEQHTQMADQLDRQLGMTPVGSTKNPPA